MDQNGFMAYASSRSETIYDGIRYRSRQHARWAVFFDILGLEHLYEPQAFKVESAVHSPTFLLPGIGNDIHTLDLTIPGVFIDVPVVPPTNPELEVAKTISSYTDRNLCIFHGTAMTVGLEWWPTVLEKPRPCFFSQCPFCGRFGVSSTGLEDGQREGWANVHGHASMEEHQIPERYNVLGHCSQDILVTPHSPALDVAYEAARTIRFGDDGVRERVATSGQAVLAVLNTKTYCTSELTEKIIANALKWAEEKSEWMRFDGAPWWVQHKKDAAAGIKDCTCYSCAHTRRHAKEKEAAEAPVTTRLQ
jgi:hypothetical protein